MKKGDLIEVEVEIFAFEGKGIAKLNLDENNEKKFIVFVEGAYPGDKVIAKLQKIKKSYAEAKVESVITASPERVTPRCKYFGVCGGCKQQSLEYSKQVYYKQEQVVDVFQKIGGLTEFEILPALKSEHDYYYRNKMEYSFADKRWLTDKEIATGEEIDKYFALGLHIPNLFDKVLDINECYLQSELSVKILNFTRDFFKSRNTTIYTTKTHSGYLRNLVVKQSFHTNDLMVNLVTFTDEKELMQEYTDALLKEIPQVTTVINNINERKALVATGDYEKVYFGPGFIYDKIGEKIFRVSANSFFQTNTLQAKDLYQTALDFAGMTGDEIVYDLYAGAGTISIFVSDSCKRVYAFETVDSSIADAEINIGLNKAANVEFIKADLYKTFMPYVNNLSLPVPDIIILDPPRSGMHANTINDVLGLRPQKIVYVSCNPATQARDLKELTSNGYKLIKIKPVDMFPQTYHIENVALLVKDA